MTTSTTTQALSLNSEALGWLRQHTVKALIGGVEQPAIDGRKLHEWLEVTNLEYADWLKRRLKQHKAQEHRNFIRLANLRGKTGRGGHNRKEYLLTLATAQEIIASDKSPRGRALLRAVLDIAELAEKGDFQFASYVVQQMPSDVHRLAITAVAEDHMTDKDLIASIGDPQMRQAVKYQLEIGTPFEKVREWINERNETKDSTKVFAATCHRRGVNLPDVYNAIGVNLGHGSIAAQRARNKLKPWQTPRNRMTREGLAEVQLTELRAARVIEQKSYQGNPTCCAAVSHVAQQLKRSRPEGEVSYFLPPMPETPPRARRKKQPEAPAQLPY